MRELPENVVRSLPLTSGALSRLCDSMHSHSNAWRLLNILLVSGMLALPAYAQDGAARIQAEVARLQASLKEKPISPKLGDVGKMTAESLQAASAEVNRGRLYVGLEKLAEARDLIQGARALADNPDVVKGGLPAFEQAWGAASLKLTALDRQAGERNWSHAPAALQALAEAAQGKSLPLLEGGRGFATATHPQDGLFYVGQAQGEADFAEFCASLELPRKSASFPLRSWLPELQALQNKTNAAFQPPKSIELHSRFIGLNAALKLAQELDARKFYAGALYEYLEAVRRYGMLDAALLDAARQSALKVALADAEKKLAASQRDDSIAQLFLERAASYISHADGSAPTADEWRGAQVIVDQVLPAYVASARPASPLQKPSGKLVTITLVRWPYT